MPNRNEMLDAWIDREFFGVGVAIRAEDDPPIPGEPFMSIESAKDLARRAVAYFTQWHRIEDARKDGTRILVILKDPLPDGRNDIEKHWHGIPFVARHPGICEDGFDIGWNFAAPVGMGGFPDTWIAGWQPLPDPPAQ